MSPFEALLLGLIQGLTEFLPISSSAHVQIAQELLGLSSLTKPQLTAFIATIQIGTELAVVTYFFKTILEVLRAFFKSGLQPFSKQPPEARLGWLIIIGTLPIVALGLAFQIADDILDVTGDEATAGKRVNKDADAGKATFVSLLGLDAAKARARALISEAKA
mgnify:CR=1 FL=1